MPKFLRQVLFLQKIQLSKQLILKVVLVLEKLILNVLLLRLFKSSFSLYILGQFLKAFLLNLN